MVLADGCFDPIHVGHIRYLSAAAAFGTLTVRIAPDPAVLEKGRFLFQKRDERAKTIAALRSVEAVCFDETLAGAVLRIMPDYLIKGDDWRARGLPADVVEACERVNTVILFVETQERTSTERLRT